MAANDACEVFGQQGDTSVVSERSALVGRSKPKCRYYRFSWVIRNKPARLVFVMVALTQCFDPNVLVATNNGHVLFDVFSGCSLVYPIAGLLADVKFGRYETGIASLVLSLLACLTMIVGYCFPVNSTVHIVLPFSGLILGNFSRTSFMIVMLSFGVDQLQGASGEELTAFLQWFYFCHIIGWAISVPVTCSLVMFQSVINAGAHTLCILVAFIILVSSRKYMITEPRVKTNPLMTIVKVLKYAKNHQYPKNRSALTYWENNYPSRLDLGKEKYGGPFTEDQVQDVKTLLRMIPIIVCMLVWYMMADGYQFLPQVNMKEYQYCLTSSAYFINSVGILVTIFFNQIIIHPLFHKFYPSMLKKIGIGIFLCLLAEVGWVLIDVVISKSDETECVLKSEMEFFWIVNSTYAVIPKVITGIGIGTVGPTTLEFAFAQAPYSMRGVIVGIWFMTNSFFQTIGYILIYPFQAIVSDNDYPSCEFYFLSTKVLLMVIAFILFICLAHWYKLRFRGDGFDLHQTVRTYYTKYLLQDEEDTDYTLSVEDSSQGITALKIN